MNLIPIIKTISCTISGIGAGAIVSNLVKATTPANTKLITKVALTFGTFALSSAVGGVASKAMEKEIDEGVELLKSLTSES